MTQIRGVLFVCTANICRSPIAEAVFAHLIKERQLTDQWFTDSAGIGDWFVGRKPDPRAQNVLNKHNITFRHRARQIRKEDFDRFDFIMCMDNWNVEELNYLKPRRSKAVIQLLGSYDPNGQTIIEDPFFEKGESAYQVTYDKCYRACNAFLDQY